MTIRRRLLRLSEGAVDARTPLMAMIDVVFLLMIFFLFDFDAIREQQLVAALERPSATRSVAARSACWLTLRQEPDGGIGFRVDDGRWLRREKDLHTALQMSLARGGSSGTLIVDALEGVAFQEVIDALALGERCGAITTTLRVDQ
ncbi:MAG: biopolymer transporter ExbD [Planctomycetes bacterium]|nr:biopolymer transporter ExbD [Planctomycetota bacterium]